MDLGYSSHTFFRIGEVFSGTFLLDEEDSTTNQTDKKEEMMRHRVATLQDILCRRLQTWVDGEPEKFEVFCRQQIDELRKEHMGVELLQLVGYVYEQEADRFLGGVFGLVANISSKAHAVSTTFGAVRAAISLQQAQREIDNEANLEKRAELERKFTDEGLTTMFKFGKLEIENVLRQVAQSILNRNDVPRAVRRKQAEGLRLLGKTFKATKALESHETTSSPFFPSKS